MNFLRENWWRDPVTLYLVKYARIISVPRYVIHEIVHVKRREKIVYHAMAQNHRSLTCLKVMTQNRCFLTPNNLPTKDF